MSDGTGIRVELGDDGHHVVIDVPYVVARSVSAVAEQYVEDPHGVGAALETVHQHRHTYEGLASLAEVNDIPERLIDEAAAALDAVRDDFVAFFPEPLVVTLGENEARQLAVDISRCAALAAARRLEGESA